MDQDINPDVVDLAAEHDLKATIPPTDQPTVDQATIKPRMDSPLGDLPLDGTSSAVRTLGSDEDPNDHLPINGDETQSTFVTTKIPMQARNNTPPEDNQAVESTNDSKVDDEEGNLTDGTDIDPFDEWDKSFDRLKLKTAAVQARNRLAPKRVKQQKQYTQLLEDRIALLEERWELYEQKEALAQGKSIPLTTPDPPEKPAAPSDCAAKLGINPQYWDEFAADQRPAVQELYTMDILIGEPNLSRTMGSRSSKEQALLKILSGKGIEIVSAEAILEQNVRKDILEDVDSLRAKRLPERIRINSSSLQYILAAIFENGSYIVGDVRPVILLRPFKPLLKYEAVMRRLKVSLDEAAVKVKSSAESGPTNTTAKAAERVPLAGHDYSDASELPRDDDPIAQILKDLGAHPCASCCASAPGVVGVLLEFIDDWLLPVHQSLRSRDTEKVTFADLWQLLQPGDEIVRKVKTTATDYANRAHMVMRILKAKGGRYRLPRQDDYGREAAQDVPLFTTVNGLNPFVIDVYRIDFDGSKMVPIVQQIVIQPFNGLLDVRDLDAYPIEYVKGDDFRSTLIKRGEKFAQYATQTVHLQCKGIDLRTREQLDGQVIVDMGEYYNMPGLEAPTFLIPESKDIMLETNDCSRGVDCVSGSRGCNHRSENYFHDEFMDDDLMELHMREQAIFQWDASRLQAALRASTLRERDLLICSYGVFAFMLRSRQWVNVHVDHLESVERITEENGFDLLVLQKSQKHMIRSQVEEHFRKKRILASAVEDEVDIVRGKGNGLIILLHGPPGVGKTATAECTADLVDKPLFPITCGDLGASASEVEKNLHRNFQLASKWDCVLLLDEADVFLARRTKDDYQRNSVVSVFLRMMEYYTGVLFLTTNRVGHFDEAFKSRIHITLHYTPFDEEKTVAVWKTFIKKTIKSMESKDLHIEKEELTKFARWHFRANEGGGQWNGRQIRNAFQTALAMAKYEARTGLTAENYVARPADLSSDAAHGPNNKVVLTAKQFETIATTVKSFDEYMDGTMGMTFESRAKHEAYRNDRLRLQQELRAVVREERDRERDEEERYGPTRAGYNDMNRSASQRSSGYGGRPPRQSVSEHGPGNRQYHSKNQDQYPNDWDD